ncbi:hypothetical protein ACO1O0_002606 [Amphichorda felina]
MERGTEESALTPSAAGPIPAWTLVDRHAASGLIPVSPSYYYDAKQAVERQAVELQAAPVGPIIRTETLSSSTSTQTFPGLPRIDYRLYSPPLFQLSADGTTLSSRTSQHLVGNARELAAFLRVQATVPPKPQIHVRGTRRHTVDFDIRLNLMALLVPDDARLRADYMRCVGDDELALRGGTRPDVVPRVGDGGLEEWCRLFVEDAADVKAFVLQRSVVNLDTLWLEGQLRSLIASTGYRGTLAISFPTTHARVVVRSADRVHKYVTSVKTMFRPKARYEVVTAVWPFATAKFGVEGRQCVVQSEEGWWKEWRDPIKYAVATKRHGWVTNEDKLEALMEGKGRGVQPIDWDTED